MIRKSTLSLKSANKSKQLKLREFIEGYCQTVRDFIDYFWEIKQFKGSFVKKEVYDLIDSRLTASAKQLAGQHALKIVKSQRKKRRNKPDFKKQIVELTSNLVEIQGGNNSFDLWIRIKNVAKLYLPTRR